MKRPGVGESVHYVSHGSPVRPDGSQAYESECRAAIVTEAPGGVIVGLCVLNPTGMFFHPAVEHGPRETSPAPTSLCDGHDHPAGTWHWGTT